MVSPYTIKLLNLQHHGGDCIAYATGMSLLCRHMHCTAGSMLPSLCALTVALDDCDILGTSWQASASVGTRALARSVLGGRGPKIVPEKHWLW